MYFQQRVSFLYLQSVIVGKLLTVVVEVVVVVVVVVVEIQQDVCDHVLGQF